MMLSVLVIDGAADLAEDFDRQLKKLFPHISISAVTRNIQESVQWMQRNGSPDLIIADKELIDDSYESFVDECGLNCPIILTASNQPDHFSSVSSAGLERLPHSPDSLKVSNALDKYLKLIQQISGGNNTQVRKNKRTWIIAKRRREFQLIRTSEVVLIFTEHRLVFLIDKENKRYLVDADTLNEVQDQLDETIFYRANRKYIFNVNYLKSFKLYDKSQLQLQMEIPSSEDIIISQFKANDFKNWLASL